MPDSMDSFFIESVSNYQKLVDVLIAHKGEDGVSVISQEELASIVDHCQTWVGQAIKKLNTEDLCIERISLSKYIVHYRDILAQGVFHQILLLIVECVQNPLIVWEKDKLIAERRGIKLKTVQMFKSYVRTYWKKRSK